MGQENLDKIDVYNNLVLVATAPHKTKSAGGILFTDSTVNEARYQEKVGIILKLGEGAFAPSEGYAWSNPPKAGSLVFYRVTDSMELGVNGVSCRLVNDSAIIGSVQDIGVIW